VSLPRFDPGAIIHPLIWRELRVALRNRALQRQRMAVAIPAAVLCAFCMFFSLVDRGALTVMLHQFLYIGGLYVAVVRPVEAALGLFAEEREGNTLAFLYLAGMNSLGIFVAKLLGGLLTSSVELLALVPMLAIPFLGGGISLDLFIATVVSLPLVLIFSIALAVLASVLSREEGGAMMLAVGIAAVLCLLTPLPYIIGKQLTGVAPFSADWLLASPAWSPYLIASRSAPPMHKFWINCTMTLFWTLTALISAGILLDRTWREGGPAATGWRRKWADLLHGSDTWRRALRERMLTANPFAWLVCSKRRPVVHFYAILAVLGAVWIAGCAIWPEYWPGPMSFYLTAFVLVCVKDWLVLLASAQQMAEARRTGALELLLTTPLEPAEIMDGILQGIQAQFRPVRRLLLALFIIMAVCGLATRVWNTPALITYFVVWGVLIAWCASAEKSRAITPAWIALNSGRTLLAFSQAGGGGWQLLWIIFNLRNLINAISRGASGFPTGSVPELIFVLLIGLVVVSLAVCASAQNENLPAYKSAVTYMRQIARQPLPDPRDPELKKWKWKEPLLTERS
jgi:hypothetical protein